MKPWQAILKTPFLTKAGKQNEAPVFSAAFAFGHFLCKGY